MIAARLRSFRAFHSLRRPEPVAGKPADRERGQVLVIFAGGIVLFVLLLAIVLDVSWYWANTLRVQRAADAAALAGAVYLPGDTTTAFLRAREEAQKNGYINGMNATVTPVQDDENSRQLNVSINTNVSTFFMRVIGINQIAATRSSKAEFVLPVPMGSPENYYGVFGTLREATYTHTETVTNTTRSDGNTDWLPAGTATSGGQWATPDRATGTDATSSNNNQYATEDTTNHAQMWENFRFLNTNSPPASPRPRLPNPAANQSLDITGIEVRLTNVGLAGSGGATTNCRLNVELSWNAGAAGSFSTLLQSDPITSTATNPTTNLTIPTTGGLAAWGSHAWTRSDFDNTRFRVRLTWIDGNSGCSSGRSVKLDALDVRVSYTLWTTTTTTQTVEDTTNDLLEGPGTPCENGASGCYNPDGAALNPRGFWATMNTRGASNVNGDAHQPRYDVAGSTLAPVCPAGDSRSCYDPEQYYNYAVEMPPNSSGGYIYVFDPGFCATDSDTGVGDRWFGTSNSVSSWYEIRGTNNTPYNLSDDPLIVSSGSLFTSLDAADGSMGASGGADCRKRDTAYGDGRDYHLSWYLLNPSNPLTGGPNGTVYRIHTTGTDPGGSLLSNTDGEQSFALYASASGGTPRIYGLGAMQMFTPLKSNGGATFSEFYLAQIDAVHAGKTVVIELWDPGDTSPLAANLQILIPGYGAALMDYRAKVGTSNTQVNTACNSNTGNDVSSIVTSTGASLGVFNGCWLTIEIPVPTGYTATDDGWWKIRYNMNGNGTSNDVTTWKVSIRGNPVHLKVP